MRFYMVMADGDKKNIFLVPHGFSWGAFVFGPFWMIWHGMWRSLAPYLLLAFTYIGVVEWLGLGETQAGLASLASLLFLAAIGNGLRRWELRRQGMEIWFVCAARRKHEVFHRLLAAHAVDVWSHS